MTFSVAWTEQAQEDLGSLDKPIAKRVVKAVVRFAETNAGDVKKLQGSEDYRLRVGDWRVRFRFDHSAQTIRVLTILHRSEAYR
jgi:mRNA interferase RelE/StbE